LDRADQPGARKARPRITLSTPATLSGTFHFTPASTSWLNAVENFFSKITRQRIRRGVFRSIQRPMTVPSSPLSAANRVVVPPAFGELLQRAAENGFDVFVTADQNLQFQQNLAQSQLAVIETRACRQLF
jgi:hypothetical protein